MDHCAESTAVNPAGQPNVSGISSLRVHLMNDVKHKGQCLSGGPDPGSTADRMRQAVEARLCAQVFASCGRMNGSRSPAALTPNNAINEVVDDAANATTAPANATNNAANNAPIDDAIHPLLQQLNAAITPVAMRWVAKGCGSCRSIDAHSLARQRC